jgi:hypothetical protein
LRNRVDIKVSRGARTGPDIQLITKKEKKKINLEIQQFDSGRPWRTQIIPSWKERHEFLTLIVFPEPVLERVISKIDAIQEYEFFKQEDVLLFSDAQISELVSFIGSIVLTKDI